MEHLAKYYRWKYLETGVSKIMINLADGIDMNTVSRSLFTVLHADYWRLALWLVVYGSLHVSFPWISHENQWRSTNNSTELCTIFVRHKRQWTPAPVARLEEHIGEVTAPLLVHIALKANFHSTSSWWRPLSKSDHIPHQIPQRSSRKIKDTFWWSPSQFLYSGMGTIYHLREIR